MVAGVPRSGTSLVMQMLAAGGVPVLTDEARPPDIHNPKGYLEFAPAKGLRRDASWLPDARGRAVKVVHALVSTLPVGFDYRLVLVRRDLREVVDSQQAMLPRPVAGGLPPERLVEIFDTQLGELDAWLAQQPHFRVLRLEHATLMAGPQHSAAELSAFLGGGLDCEAMAAVVDPALHRQKR